MMSHPAIPSRSRLLRLPLAASLLAVAISGCSDSGALNPQQDSTDDPAPAESVNRVRAPSTRSGLLTAKLNLYREQTYGGSGYAVPHSDVLYTAALRHAVNINTVNSFNASTNGPGAPGNVLTALTPIDFLSFDWSWTTTTTDGDSSSSSLGADGRFYPALYTSDLVWDRVNAVRGGPDLLRSPSESLVSELYTFSGNIWTEAGIISDYRGFNEDNVNDIYDAVDNMWYTTRGRIGLMRASLRSFGYARKDDPYEGNVIRPPYPLLNNRFTGVGVLVHDTPLVSQFGYWPNNGNVEVTPYGLDTDIGGATGYSGVPLHFTLPLAEPVLTGSGNLSIDIEKILPRTRIAGQRQLRIFANQAGLSVDLPSASAPGADFKFTGSTGTATLVDDGLIVQIDQDFIVPNGYSVIKFAPDVSLSDVRPGDQILLTYPDDVTTLNVNEAALMSGIYTVFANKDRADYGTITDPQYASVVTPYQVNNINIDQLPPHSLAVSYVGGASETFTGSGVFYPSQDPLVTFSVLISLYYPYDWFEVPNQEPARADVVSASISRSTVENRAELGLRDGEFFIIPTEPLEPNSTYRVRIRARTISEERDWSWVFTTNGRIPPVR